MSEFQIESKAKSISQAQIIVGEAGAIRTLASRLAKGVNCLNTEGEDPCGHCISCKVFEAGNHPDTFYVKKTKAASIGVDDVRDQVVAPMSTKPFGYKYKVFIIDKADTLTHAAQSALLKTIEEPAPYGVFLFLAPSEHSFLPTILSRCSLRKVQGTNTFANSEMQALANEIADNAHTWDVVDAFKQYKKFEPFKESKETLQEALDTIYNAYGTKIAATGGQAPPQSWLDATSAIVKTKQVLAQNGNTQLAIELLMAKLSKN